ncbi:SMARCD [Lepeophtheirus salmonis]|uniref:SMARCD n=1 Tax=Lepeophtheirus salmonis TaxID=72036 RepID=A0A7R8CST5_LEPSM|nr:SMARCD [Lepeophtheirus salmonis]CAF2919951.1 SMARCD [Lepeophtheirus salmonis]
MKGSTYAVTHFSSRYFKTDKMKFAELPQRLNPLLYPPDPIVINHVISVEDFRHSDQKKTACFDIDVELDDTLKTQMNSFLLSTSSQQEILSLNSKIHETVNSIVSLKTSREFYLRFANNPQLFISKWITSQSRNVKAITDTKDYEQRKTDFYYQAWAQEAVCRYFYNQVKKRGAELGISEGFFDI